MVEDGNLNTIVNQLMKFAAVSGWFQQLLIENPKEQNLGAHRYSCVKSSEQNSLKQVGSIRILINRIYTLNAFRKCFLHFILWRIHCEWILID